MPESEYEYTFSEYEYTFDVDLWPVTIVMNRHGGGWFAFNRDPEFIPDEINGGFSDQQNWIDDNRNEVGQGNNPEAAVNDLVRCIKNNEPIAGEMDLPAIEAR